MPHATVYVLDKAQRRLRRDRDRSERERRASAHRRDIAEADCQRAPAKVESAYPFRPEVHLLDEHVDSCEQVAVVLQLDDGRVVPDSDNRPSIAENGRDSVN
jgi:hypothetical protein